MAQETEITTNKLLVVLLSSALVGGGSTGAFIKYTTPDAERINKELVAGLADVSKALARLQRNPEARPDPYTGTMAREDFARVQKQIERVGSAAERTDSAISSLRTRIAGYESRVRAMDVSASLLQNRHQKVEEALESHEKLQEHPGADRRLKPLEANSHRH